MTDKWEETKNKKASRELIYEKLEAEVATELYAECAKEQEQEE